MGAGEASGSWSESTTHPAPNQVLEPTPNSLRSCVGFPLPCFFPVYGYRPLLIHDMRGAVLPAERVRKLSAQMNVELMVG